MVRCQALGHQARSPSLLLALRHNLRRIVRLRRAVRASRPEIVISFLTATNVTTLLATSGLRVPVIVSERGDPDRSTLPSIWRSLRCSIG